MKEEDAARLEELIRMWPDVFERGRSDCCAFAARWAEIKSGRLPGEDVLDGGPYTLKEAMLVLARFGGMEEMIRRHWTAAGWREVSDPEDGDVVVCAAATALGGETVGVWRNGRVVTINERGGVDLWRAVEVKGAWRWV